MEIVIQFLLLVVGFVLLVKGADVFVEGAAGIADKFGIPQIVIGLTIVAMGTSAPEAAVSITSAIKGSAGITVGNVVGSNIMNILVILGVTALIATLPVGESTIKYEMPFLLLTTAAFFFFGFTGGVIGRIEGVALWVLFIVYLIYLFISAKNGKSEEEKEGKKRPVWLLLIMAVAGAALVVYGADVAVDAATKIAQFFGMSDRFIGLTIVAFGTSLPELVTGITAARKGQTDIAIGNIVGSNIFNILFVCGTTALITPVIFARSFLVDTAVAFAAALFLWVSVLFKKRLGKISAGIMLIMYAGYFVYLLS